MKGLNHITGAFGIVYMIFGSLFTSVHIFDPTRIPSVKPGISSPLWLTGTILFLMSYIFTYVVNLLIRRDVLLKTSIVLGILSTLILFAGWLLTTEYFLYTLVVFGLQCGISLICWLPIVMALLAKEQPKP